VLFEVNHSRDFETLHIDAGFVTAKKQTTTTTPSTSLTLAVISV